VFSTLSSLFRFVGAWVASQREPLLWLQDAQWDEIIVKSYGHTGPERRIAELLTIVKLAGDKARGDRDMNSILSVGHAYFQPLARYAFNREGVFR
jgi:hypothetical protein